MSDLYNQLINSIEDELCPICFEQVHKSNYMIERPESYKGYDKIYCSKGCFHLTNGKMIVDIKPYNFGTILNRMVNRFEIRKNDVRIDNRAIYHFPEKATILHFYEFCKTIEDNLMFL